MSPENKAKELVYKMKLATDEFGYININIQRHKNCALILVDEIIKDRERLKDALFYNSEYWQKVKEEMQKL
jgi:hypothetical protein